MSLRKPPKPANYKLDLLENGLDFVRSGIDLYFGQRTPQPRSHKYAILHVFSGTLLLLKARLARIRPSLVFVREAEAGQPGANTTNYHKTLKRLEAHGVPIDPTRRATLDEIRKLRNAIEHYQVNLTLARSRETIAELVSFAYIFCRDELCVHVDDTLSGKARERFYELKEVGDRIQQDMEESAIAEAEAEEQYFRGFELQYAAMSPEELLQYAAQVDNSRIDDLPRALCPSCGKRTLLYLEVGACTNSACRTTYQLDDCRYCHGAMIRTSGFSVCDSCLGG